ncbi:PucR family transcriptional regulator [Kineococcus aurantiacus]
MTAVTPKRDFLTIADLVAMPHLGLRLMAGGDGARHAVLWTHTSELADPGPWLEGGELLIVNGFGIPAEPDEQVEYLTRLSLHRLAGLAVSARSPTLTPELLATADRLAFPVLRIPRQIPFVELSHLVANARDRSARSRLSRHLQIFETLRLRNSPDSDVVKFYTELERVSGYRLALVSPAGRPLLAQWPWMPDDLAFDPRPAASKELRVVPGGFVIPLVVGDRVTAHLVGRERTDAVPGGLAALQHVASLAELDAIDDQRHREALHREGGELLASALDAPAASEDHRKRLSRFGLDPSRGLRVLAIAGRTGHLVPEQWVRDWLCDRDIPHLLLLRQGVLLAVVDRDEPNLREMAIHLAVDLGVSSRCDDPGELARLRRQAVWSLTLANESAEPSVVLADQQQGLARWLNPDVQTIKELAGAVLRPLMEYDAQNDGELLRTLTVYFRNQGRVRPSAAELFIHEHTLTYRLKRIEQLVDRDLKSYRDLFELWLATVATPLMDRS